MADLSKEELLSIEPYKIIYSSLGRGYYLARSAADLCSFTGMHDRDVRKAIEKMRECGICIVSECFGYYFPATEAELERYIRRMEKTARSYFYSLRSAKRELRRMKERSQMKIEE